MLGKVAAISQFEGFSKWALAADHVHAQAIPQRRTATYFPQYFTPAEYRTVDVLCELIIPADESPGAREAGVSEFIDFMVSQDDDLQHPFRSGLSSLDASAVKRHAGRFVELAPAQQESLLSELVQKQSPDEIAGHEFFPLLRKYTVIGYYTSRIGLEELDYPGLRLYSASPACPHKNDPEHKHLPAAR